MAPPQSERRRRYSPQRFTPLTASMSQVLHEVRNEQFLRWPAQMKSDPATRDNTKYCEFHRDYGHRTDNCIQLRREIEYLIQRGYLRLFIAPGNQAQSQTQNQNQAPTQPPPPRQTTTQHQQPLGEIHVISGGFAGGGESSSARKAHLRSIRSADMGEVQAVSKVPRVDTTITFSDSDLEGCQHPHDDPLVVRAIVANTTVHRVLVDNGSSADIIFASAFDKMGIGREKLEPVSTHLRGFFRRKSVTIGIDPTGANPRGAPLPSNDNSKVPYSRRSINLQHVAGQALSQRNKSHPLSIPFDNQIPDGKRGRDGSRRSAGGSGMLHRLYETTSGRQRERRRA